MVVHGAPKSLKSMLTKNLVFGVSDGGMVWDNKYWKASRPLKTLLVEQEHGEDMLLDSLAKIQGKENYFHAPDNMHYVSRDMRLSIDTTEGMKALAEHVVAVEPDVLILDPWSEFHTVDDRETGKQLAMIRAVRSLRNGMALVVVHHDCKPGEFRSHGNANGMRGSALRQASDANISVTRTTSARSGRDAVRLAFELRYGGDPNGGVPYDLNYDKETDTFWKDGGGR